MDDTVEPIGSDNNTERTAPFEQALNSINIPKTLDIKVKTRPGRGYVSQLVYQQYSISVPNTIKLPFEKIVFEGDAFKMGALPFVPYVSSRFYPSKESHSIVQVANRALYDKLILGKADSKNTKGDNFAFSIRLFIISMAQYVVVFPDVKVIVRIEFTPQAKGKTLTIANIIADFGVEVFDAIIALGIYNYVVDTEYKLTYQPSDERLIPGESKTSFNSMIASYNRLYREHQIEEKIVKAAKQKEVAFEDL